MTQESIGSASQSTSTESSVVSHLLERNSGDCVERDTLTTSNVLLAGQIGRGTIPSPFVVIVDFGNIASCFCIIFWILISRKNIVVICGV
jgi:hypothetical protein